MKKCDIHQTCFMFCPEWKPRGLFIGGLWSTSTPLFFSRPPHPDFFFFAVKSCRRPHCQQHRGRPHTQAPSHSRLTDLGQGIKSHCILQHPICSCFFLFNLFVPVNWHHAGGSTGLRIFARLPPTVNFFGTQNDAHLRKRSALRVWGTLRWVRSQPPK